LDFIITLLFRFYFGMSSYGNSRNNSRYYQFRPRAGYASGSFAPANARRWTPRSGAAPYRSQARRPAVNRKYLSRPKFATVSFNRDIEKKYLDRALVSVMSTNATSDTTTVTNQDGRMFKSNAWKSYSFSGTSAALTPNTTNNLIRSMIQGTTAETRIGNKITCKYVKGAITINAAKLTTPAAPGSKSQYGESHVDSQGVTYTQYLRTTWRVALVKDLQVNSADPYVTWDQVFQLGQKASDEDDGNVGGVHSELNIANMGRFQILQDRTFDLDADDPQKTWRYLVSGSDIGQVRYNGPTELAYSDKGLYIIAAAYTNGIGQDVAPAQATVIAPTLTMHSRFCFTDS